MALVRRGPQTVSATIAGVRSSTRAPTLPAVVRMQPTEAEVAKPAALARMLRETHRELDSLRHATASVLAGAVFLQNITLPIGNSYQEHRLGRTPLGVFVTLAPSYVVSSLALPATVDPARFFGVVNGSGAAMVASFLVF